MPQQGGMPGQGDQCIYCQLIDNPDQLMLVGETDNFYAWLEVQPRAKGQTQIVPKDHIESVLEFSPKEYQEAMNLVREVAEKAKKGLDADGVSVVMNMGEAAGQMMPHAYISVFPRFEEDERAGTPTGAIFPQKEGLQDKLPDIQSSMEGISVDFGQEEIEPHPESEGFKGSNIIDRGEVVQSQKEGEEKEKKKETGEESGEEEEEKDLEELKEHDGKSFEWV